MPPIVGSLLMFAIRRVQPKEGKYYDNSKKSDPSVIDTGDKEDMDNGEINQKDNGDDALKNELYEHGQSTSTVAA